MNLLHSLLYYVQSSSTTCNVNLEYERGAACVYFMMSTDGKS